MESSQSQPQNAELLEGSQFLQQSNFKAAQESYKQTLEREPENLEAIYGLGIIYQYEKKCEEAKSYFERALSNDIAGSGKRLRASRLGAAKNKPAFVP